MTTWIENPEGGRARGPVGLAQAWLAVLVRPRRFFRTGIAPGDQAPGLVFAIVVAVVHTATRFAYAPSGQSIARLALVYLVVAVLVTPVVLHLAAALQTVLLVPLVSERAGVSQTVQVIAYAAAPCALAGIVLPTLWVTQTVYGGAAGAIVGVLPALWLVTAVYGAVLLVIGIAVVHETSLVRAAVGSALPAVLVFGYGFQGVYALVLLTGSA